MMTIEVKVNGRLIGAATIHNLSQLAPLSEYNVEGWSGQHPVTGHPEARHRFKINLHDRSLSAWALVAKAAGQIAGREGFS